MPPPGNAPPPPGIPIPPPPNPPVLVGVPVWAVLTPVTTSWPAVSPDVISATLLVIRPTSTGVETGCPSAPMTSTVYEPAVPRRAATGTFSTAVALSMVIVTSAVIPDRMVGGTSASVTVTG